MLSIVIPIINNHEITNECIDNLTENAASDLDIVVIDNGSETPYWNEKVNTVIYHERNTGFWPSILEGLNAAKNNIVLTMHNDVMIWEKNFDLRLESHFSKDYLLSLCGFFGGRGVGLDGGRGNPESNMVNRKYGTHGSLHGFTLTDSHPAVVFDSLAMCFSKRHLEQISTEDIPMHHWCDRIVTLRLVKAGLHCRTVGVEFDHGGGFTSARIGPKNNAMEDYCKANNIPFVENWDMSLYMYGLGMFQREFREVIPESYDQIWVDANYNYIARKG